MNVRREAAPVAGGLAVTTEPTRVAGAEGSVGGRAYPGLIRFALAVAALVPVFLASWIVTGGRDPVAAWAYWVSRLDTLYAIRDEGLLGAFVYSPAAGQAIAPFTVLPWEAFALGLIVLNIAALVWLVGPWLGLVCLVPFSPVVDNIAGGNINLFIAVAVVVGFRHPGAWAFVLLTKVGPGVGLLWFLVRREWRPLFIAGGVTFGVVAVSFALAPGLWVEWIELLRHNGGAVAPGMPIPLAPRLVAAAAIVTYGAKRNLPGMVAIAAMLALPVIFWSGWSVLVALPRLIRRPQPMMAAQNRPPLVTAESFTATST